MSNGMFVGAENTIMNGIGTALGGQSGIYGDMIAPVIIAWATLYAMISGYRALAGKLQTPLPDVVWNLGVMGIVLAFVTNAGGWFDMVNTAIDGVRTGFSGNESGIWGQLDGLWGCTQTMAESLIKADGSYFQFSGQIARMLTWLGTILVMFPAAIVNLAAEATLKLLLATGPLFVACLAFGWFRSMFENWMKAIMSCLITILLSTIGVNVVLSMITNALENTQVVETSNLITTGMIMLGFGVMGCTIVILAAKIATSLSGSGVSGAVAGLALGAGAAATYLGIKQAPSVAKGAYGAAGKAGEKLGDAYSWAKDRQARTKMMEGMRDASIERMKRLNNPQSKIF